MRTAFRFAFAVFLCTLAAACGRGEGDESASADSAPPGCQAAGDVLQVRPPRFVAR